MKSSDQAALPPGGLEEHELGARRSPSPSTAPSPSLRSQVDPAIERPPQVEPGLDHQSSTPEQDARLNEHKALRPPEQESAKSSSGALGKVHKAHAEPFSSPHSTRQPPVTEHSFASRSAPEKGVLSDTAPESHETMGKAISKLRENRNRSSRDETESPETSISDSAPTPPLVQSRQSTMSGLGKGSPGSRSPHFRKDEARLSSIGEHTPSRRSRLPRIQEVNEEPKLDPEIPDKSKAGPPTLPLTALTPVLSTVYEEVEQSVDPPVSNLSLPTPSSSRPNTHSRPSSTMSQVPSTARDVFSRSHPLIPVTAPKVTIVHLECYQGHKNFRATYNRYCPLPCAVCKVMNSTATIQKCIFCDLWLCQSCYNRLTQIEGRSLKELIDQVAKGKENRRNPNSGNMEREKAKGEAEDSGVLASTDVNAKETEDKK